MLGTTDAIRDSTLDVAMFRSRNTQKKEYQDEIWMLTNELSKYRLKLDKVQKQVITEPMAHIDVDEKDIN